MLILDVIENIWYSIIFHVKVGLSRFIELEIWYIEFEGHLLNDTTGQNHATDYHAQVIQHQVPPNNAYASTYSRQTDKHGEE